MWKWILLVAIASVVPAWAQDSDVSINDLNEIEVRNKVIADASLLVEQGRFTDIDRLMDEYVREETRTPSGLWLSGIFLRGVVEGLAPPKPTPANDDAWDRAEGAARKWAEEAPQSSAARVALGKLIASRGWRARGGGYASAVTKQGWRDFYKHVRTARIYLEKEHAVASANPEYYAALIRLMMVGEDKVDPSGIYEEGLGRFPGYYPMHFEMVSSMLPKWLGDPASIEVFARFVVERTRLKEGASMYARIYWVAAQSQPEYRHALFKRTPARWDFFMQGFEDVMARYPAQWNVQHYAKFACDAEDYATVARLAQNIMPPIYLDAWASMEKYDECMKLSESQV